MAGVAKTGLKDAAAEGCKWCTKGECWSHGQIEKPKSAGGKSGGGKGWSDSEGGKGGWGGSFGGKGEWGSMDQMMAFMYTMMQAKGCGKGFASKGGDFGKGNGGGSAGGSWSPKVFKVDKSGGELGEYTGSIKSFNENKNYGFIVCEALTSAGYGDVFLHGDMKKGYQPGQTVKFSAVLNKDGKPVAIDLKSGLNAHRRDALQQPGGNFTPKKTFEVDRSGGELGEYTGTIKSFNNNKNYGFIVSEALTDAGHGDVFLHGDMKKDYQPGQTVKFTAVLNKDGKPVAIDLKSGLK